ncbi:hypothetical protein [Hyphomonas sp. CY54-11-8]|uniref:hypothetical protein n=1 Tax=Hyphomonas sp. CY54-11-8 TaxID=1280944 RepID=UPI000458B37B|nr:hypothetical protein [Hyphomonas sp. CY54-11-8]KCZ47726.1 hypothetical protein HY17_04420 [Hyphomonas sp. CY54-11-8]
MTIDEALENLRNEVVTFCFLIEQRGDISEDVKLRAERARKAVYGMARAVSAKQPVFAAGGSHDED